MISTSIEFGIDNQATEGGVVAVTVDAMGMATFVPFDDDRLSFTTTIADLTQLVVMLEAERDRLLGDSA